MMVTRESRWVVRFAYSEVVIVMRMAKMIVRGCGDKLRNIE